MENLTIIHSLKILQLEYLCIELIELNIYHIDLLYSKRQQIVIFCVNYIPNGVMYFLTLILHNLK